MRKFLRNTRRGWMIFNEADKATGGGEGGQTAEEVKAAAEKEAADKAAADQAEAEKKAAEEKAAAEKTAASSASAGAKPTVFQRGMAMLQDKAALIAQIAEKDGTIAGLTAKLTTALADLAEVRGKFAALTAQSSEFTKLIEKLESEKKTVEAAAADKVASLGFPANQLPPAAATDTGKKTGAELKAEWEKIDDARAATLFYRANKAAIDAAYREPQKTA